MALGTNHITTTTHAVYIPEVWAKQVQLAFETKLIWKPRVLFFTGDGFSFGDTVHFPKMANKSANDKSASTAVSFNQSSNEGEVSVSIDKYKYSADLLEDIVAKQSKYNIVPFIQRKQGHAIAKAVDTDLATAVVNGSPSNDDVGTLGSGTLDDATIIQAIVKLDSQDVDEDERSFIFHPSAYGELLKIDKYTNINYRSGEKPVSTGNIGQLYGIPTFKSNNVQASGGGYYNVLMHREAFVLIMQTNLMSEIGRVIEYLGDAIITSQIYGLEEYRPEAYVKILT